MFKKRLHRCLGVLVMFIMLAHFIGVNFFSHTHIQDGVKQSHSHPYYPGSSTSHSHSVIEFNTISQLSSLNFIIAAFSFLFAISFYRKTSYIAERLILSQNNFFDDKRLRAPPAL